MGVLENLGNYAKQASGLGILTGGSSGITGALSGLPVIGPIFAGAQDAQWNERDYQEQKRQFNYNYLQQEQQFAQNFGLQKDAYLNQLQMQEYEKNLQQTMFAREDNAVQRRMSDLVKSGLSKTLAAGSAAGAGSPISLSGVTAPQGQAAQGQAAQHGIRSRGRASYAELMQALLTDNAIQSSDQELKNLQLQGQLINAQTNQSSATAALDYHDLNYMKDHGLWRGSTQSSKIVSDIDSALKSITGGGFKSIINSISDTVKKNLNRR